MGMNNHAEQNMHVYVCVCMNVHIMYVCMYVYMYINKEIKTRHFFKLVSLN